VGMAYADNVNLLRNNTDTKRKKLINLIDASKETGSELNAEK
jgi:hypothetical protein